MYELQKISTFFKFHIYIYIKYQISTIVQKKKCWYPAPSQAELYNGTFYLFAVSVLGPQRVKAEKNSEVPVKWLEINGIYPNTLW